MSHDRNRRLFLKACARTALASAALGASGALRPALADVLEDAPRARLVDSQGNPIRASELAPHQSLIFNYPYVATPAMLVRLQFETIENLLTTDMDGHEYTWPGGVGPKRDIVAYAAICAHALSYVGHETAFLHYSKGPTAYSDHERVIICCAHGSVYDPAAAARVVHGPAPAPLAAVTLEHDPATDEIWATGVVGTEIYARFYAAYKRELRKEYGRKAYRKMVSGDVIALPPEQYSEDVLDC
ncbi:MAG: (2Fe-2S)-binding protein [Alphaproteobacteria bacterium]|nr:MAG: (2Fe-2S)-binding protein [Alphaproteobacteria bacterium]